MKEEFNKYIEVWGKKLNNQLKNSDESLSSRLDQIEDRISGPKDMVDELEHSDEDKDK
jgi:hypothetical protein